MIRTVFLLIFSIIIVPIMAYKYWKPLDATQHQALITLIYLTTGIALACFFVGEITKNYSQTDKLWSITPIIYSWITASYDGYSIRMIFLATLVTIWGVRLSYNFNRRGGYSWKFWTGEEDYRWAILREKEPFNKPWVFTLFNLGFICLYQHFLILFFTLPILLSIGVQEVFWVDYVLAALFLGFVYIEWKSDQEQWEYQKTKQEKIKNNEPLDGIYKQGFIHTGLWAIVRHPNYAAEQSIWIVFYCFSIVATGLWINWSIIGCILLVILFKSSSDFSEEISASKYPDYKEYQKRVGRFFPKIFTKNS